MPRAFKICPSEYEAVEIKYRSNCGSAPDHMFQQWDQRHIGFTTHYKKVKYKSSNDFSEHHHSGVAKQIFDSFLSPKK